MKPTNATVKLLEQIRDAARETNTRIDQTNARIDTTNERLDGALTRIDRTNDRLDQTIVRADQFDAKLGQLDARLGQLDSKLGQTNDRLEETRIIMFEGFDSVKKRMIESEIRTCTMMAEISGTLQGMRSLLEDRRGLTGRVSRCEQDIVVLKERAGLK